MATGAELLVAQLTAFGATTGFGVPGESYLSVLDAIARSNGAFRFITCRQEGGAAFAAEAWGKLSGAPGIAFVTRGPGATNAAIGVHTARQDSTPMILFIGQVARADRDREAFQEVDYRQMFGPLAKWAAEIDTASRIPEYLMRAFQVATSGRPGPVVLALPEDMLDEEAHAEIIPALNIAPPLALSGPVDEALAALAAAKAPLILAGGPGWSDEAVPALQNFAEAADIPVLTSFRAKDRIDNRHVCYAGDCGIGAGAHVEEALKGCDVLLVLGARLDEMTTGAYQRLAAPRPRQTLIHVHVDPLELNRVYQTAYALTGSPRAFLAAASSHPRQVKAQSWRAGLRAAYERFVQPVQPPGDVNPSAILARLSATLPRDAIITNGAGNYAGWVHRFHEHRGLRTQLAPQSGAMGYGLPAALAAAVRHPDRLVIAHAGDGCFLMNGQELATAVQFELKIVICVWDNGSYGTIRMHQERAFPGMVSGTDLRNPDFAALARAYGAGGFSVTRTADFAAAFAEAQARSGPSLIHIKTELEAITPATTLSAIRAKAQGKG